MHSLFPHHTPQALWLPQDCSCTMAMATAVSLVRTFSSAHGPSTRTALIQQCPEPSPGVQGASGFQLSSGRGHRGDKGIESNRGSWTNSPGQPFVPTSTGPPPSLPLEVISVLMLPAAPAGRQQWPGQGF